MLRCNMHQYPTRRTFLNVTVNRDSIDLWAHLQIIFTYFLFALTEKLLTRGPINKIS